MKDVNRISNISPAVSDDQQQLLDTDQIRAIALRVGTGGDLHPYLQNQPHWNWFKTIGDDVIAKLCRGEPVSWSDIHRLHFALGFGQSRQGALRKRKPESRQTKMERA